MDPEMRACVAYVVGRALNIGSGNGVHDYSQSRHRRISGEVSRGHVQGYDHDRGCAFAGDLPNVYDYGRGTAVRLAVEGDRFVGHDYGDGHAFSGSVAGTIVNIYDHGESATFAYAV